MKHPIDWTTVGLGTRPDAEIAAELGVSYDTVYRQRRNLSIPGQPKTKYDIDWTTVGLGTKPDSEIAKTIGCTPALVTKNRAAMKIPTFLGVFFNQEGGYCRSYYEAMYDAYLHWKQIPHQHEVPVPHTPYIADFFIGDEYVEIFGMQRMPAYDLKMKKKLDAYSLNGHRLREVITKEVEQLYAACPISVKCTAQRKCSLCGKDSAYLYKGMCRQCYRHNSGNMKQCVCGNQFQSIDGAQFCSSTCFHNSQLKHNWPTEQWFIEQLNAGRSRNDIAQEIGVSPMHLSSYLHALRENSNNKTQLTFRQKKQSSIWSWKLGQA